MNRARVARSASGRLRPVLRVSLHVNRTITYRHVGIESDLTALSEGHAYSAIFEPALRAVAKDMAFDLARMGAAL